MAQYIITFDDDGTKAYYLKQKNGDKFTYNRKVATRYEIESVAELTANELRMKYKFMASAKVISV